MWVVNGKTTKGNDVEYKVPAGKDTDKAFVLALAFQQHGAVNAEDPLTAETTVRWTSDNVMTLPTPIKLFERDNFAVDRRIGKGLWERHTPRAFRSLEAAEEVMESASSEYPGEKFRIVANVATATVVAISKNAQEAVAEVPDKPEPEAATSEVSESQKAQNVEEAAAEEKPKPRTRKAA